MSTWTLEHLRFLIEHRMQERIDLEFKGIVPGSTGEIARWIAAMANAGGGVIVYGIEEDAQGRAIRATEGGVPLGASRHIRAAAREIDEPLEVGWWEVEEEDAGLDRGFVVVEVPDSRRAPHFVGGTAWARTEHGIRRLRRSEIARLFARAEGFAEESGLAATLRKPAEVVADIQRIGRERVLLFRNIGDRPAYGVRWLHLAGRDVRARPIDDPFPVDVMRPRATYTLRTAFVPAALPAKIEVSWRDEVGAPGQSLVVVT